MADELAGKSIKIQTESLSKSFAKYRSDLIQIPSYSIDKAAQYMSRRNGVRGKETVGELSGDMQIGPYHTTRMDENGVAITGRTLETFLGSAVKAFEPNAVRESIYGSNQFQGDALKNQPITKLVGVYLMGKCGEAFYRTLFTAKRNEAGSQTVDLYDGFKTIADAEIEAGSISAAKGNFFQTEKITDVNAVEQFEAFYDAADEKLQDENTVLFCNTSEKRAYEKDYRATFGHLNYNKEFNKLYLDGEDKCQIVGLSCVPRGFKLITPQSNMLLGFATDGDKCSFDVAENKVSHFLIDFVATMYFGAQYESISKERMLVGEDPVVAG